MSYSHTLQIYSDRDFLRSYISDETAANVVSYMNDNDFFDYLHGPLEYYVFDGQKYPWLFSAHPYPDKYANRVLEFPANNDVEFTMEPDIREMSYLFPDLIFELTVHYLAGDEYTKLYYKNGKVKTAPGEVEAIYPDFDDLEWEGAEC